MFPLPLGSWSLTKEEVLVIQRSHCGCAQIPGWMEESRSAGRGSTAGYPDFCNYGTDRIPGHEALLKITVSNTTCLLHTGGHGSICRESRISMRVPDLLLLVVIPADLPARTPDNASNTMYD